MAPRLVDAEAALHSLSPERAEVWRRMLEGDGSRQASMASAPQQQLSAAYVALMPVAAARELLAGEEGDS